MLHYYVIDLDDDRPKALFRMTTIGHEPFGIDCEKFSWRSRAWIDDKDSALVGALVKGEVFLRKITEAEAVRIEGLR